MRNYKIHLIRHGQTQGNIEGRFIGSTDNDLCKEGIDDLKLLDEKYDYPGVGAVYSSPKKRCIQTANIIYPGLSPIIVDDLREVHFGRFENKSYSELQGDKEFDQWAENGFLATAPEAEPVEEFHKRCTEAFEGVVLDMMQKKIFEATIVTHGIVIMHIMSKYSFSGGDSIVDFLVGNGIGFTVLVNTQIWMNDKKVELAGAVPQGIPDNKNSEQYALYNIDSDVAREKAKGLFDS